MGLLICLSVTTAGDKENQEGHCLAEGTAKQVWAVYGESEMMISTWADGVQDEGASPKSRLRPRVAAGERSAH